MVQHVRHLQCTENWGAASPRCFPSLTIRANKSWIIWPGSESWFNAFPLQTKARCLWVFWPEEQGNRGTGEQGNRGTGACVAVTVCLFTLIWIKPTYPRGIATPLSIVAHIKETGGVFVRGKETERRTIKWEGNEFEMEGAGAERESGVTGEWERWRERAPVPLESSPLVVNQSWQHLSLALTPLRRCSPLIPLGVRHHSKTAPTHTHTHTHTFTNPSSLVVPSHICSPILGWAWFFTGARDKHQACGTNRLLMWADRTDN